MQAYYSSLMEYRERAQQNAKENKEAYEDALGFSKFFYFLRSPVLVFRTEYPRTKGFNAVYFLLKSCQTLFHLVKHG